MSHLSGIQIEDEGVDVTGTPHTKIDYVGAGVAVTDAGSGKVTVTIPGGVAGSDEKVKISANDTTAGFLLEKLTGTAGKIVLTEVGDGGDEDLNLNVGADIFDHTTDDTDDITEGATNLFNQVHTGEVTGSVALTIATDVVDNTNLSNMDQALIKGRADGAGTGDPQDLTATQVRTIINVEDGANNYTHPNHTGDVTSVSDGAQTIALNAADNTKIADMAQDTIKGRISAGTGDPEDLTATQVRTIINVEDGATKGVSLEDEGTAVTGTPHTTLDFVGDGVTVTDAGSGEATVTISSGGLDVTNTTPADTTVNTGSGTPVVMTGMSLTGLAAGDYLVSFGCSMSNSSGGNNNTVWIYLNDVEVVGSKMLWRRPDDQINTTHVYSNFPVTVPASGSIKIYWRRSSGTASAENPYLTLIKVS